MALVFGTDGLRGVANADLSPEAVLALGRAAARVLGAPAFLVGRDTRRSSAMLSGALCAGLAAEGAEVIDLGVLPTPGVAYLAARRQMPAAVVSASHNPFSDNGVKLIGPDGRKLTVATERAIEDEFVPRLSGAPRAGEAPTGAGVGTVRVDLDAALEYASHLGCSVDLNGSGLAVVCDCANGAASFLAAGVLARVGVSARVLSDAPNGTNINAHCGSTDPRALASEVVARGADLGICFDGDADRLVAVDHTGAVVDGDRLLVLFARDLAARGELEGGGIVVTVMSNLGLRRALEGDGIAVVEVPVGDRNVADALETHGLVLGGEQSGHIVFSRRATTGDGLLTALLLLDILVRASEPLATLARDAMTAVPQVLVNVPVSDPTRIFETPAIWSEVARLESELGDDGRVLLRPSGTEQAVRVMVEAVDPGAARSLSARLAALVAAEVGAVPRDEVPPRR